MGLLRTGPGLPHQISFAAQYFLSLCSVWGWSPAQPSPGRWGGAQGLWEKLVPRTMRENIPAILSHLFVGICYSNFQKLRTGGNCPHCYKPWGPWCFSGLSMPSPHLCKESHSLTQFTLPGFHEPPVSCLKPVSWCPPAPFQRWSLTCPRCLLTLAKSEGNQQTSETVHCSSVGATRRDGPFQPSLSFL